MSTGGSIGSAAKMASNDSDRAARRDLSSAEDSSNSSTSVVFGGTHEDSSASGEEINIFQAILLNNEEVVDQLLDTNRNDYIVHIKAVDALGRFVPICVLPQGR